MAAENPPRLESKHDAQQALSELLRLLLQVLQVLALVGALEGIFAEQVGRLSHLSQRLRLFLDAGANARVCDAAQVILRFVDVVAHAYFLHVSSAISQIRGGLLPLRCYLLRVL